jgi:hypothetical protein
MAFDYATLEIHGATECFSSSILVCHVDVVTLIPKPLSWISDLWEEWAYPMTRSASLSLGLSGLSCGFVLSFTFLCQEARFGPAGYSLLFSLAFFFLRAFICPLFLS